MDEKEKDELALILVMVAVMLSPLWLIFPFTYFVLGWK
jgi:hypothetical protein